ncbi:hypothetical protein V1514DRAFT_109534 [Lipomyces japonicus]|uniref:uncharacterized protein n=1 Tax=Lipomyces japonicus TaxID=56871 RepID=UPI0034CF1AFD
MIMQRPAKAQQVQVQVQSQAPRSSLPPSTSSSSIHPLNPFLSCLFNPATSNSRSREIQAALRSPQNYILLVPVTNSLLFTIDQESSLSFTELCSHDEFLASHVIKIGGSTKTIGRARLFWTLNGRSVVIKDDFVYTNKGFKTVTQAKLLSDRVYVPTTDFVPYDTQFLLYYISRPLIGTSVSLYDFKQLSLHNNKTVTNHLHLSSNNRTTSSSSHHKISTFAQLLSQFPLIARQIQEPLNRVFEEFDCSDATEPDLVTMIEEVMEKGISLFQSLDQSVVNNMANTTGLKGHEIEKMLESYVGRNLHGKIWPRLTVLRSLKDSIIRTAVKKMKNISLAQLGVQNFWMEGGDSIERMVMTAVVEFDNLSKTENATAEVEKLVKILRGLGVVPPSASSSSSDDASGGEEDMHDAKEKTITRSSSATATDKTIKSANHYSISADVLVSLMIIVVTWSKLDNLDSHLFYMRNFSFKDVDTGEIGYALSTFEAVIFHIMNNSSKLAITSSANELIWKTIKRGEDLQAAFDQPASFFAAGSAGGIDVSEIDSLEQVYRSRNSLGESAIMMAIQSPRKNLQSLKLLLSKRDVFPIEAITKDQNARQTTLLSAAVQTGDQEIFDAVWSVIVSSARNSNADEVRRYVGRRDEWQRSIGHYLFHLPGLISTIGHLISWTDKDQNGQTPLFALCRSYDHAEYTELVKLGIDAATKYQASGGQSLRFLDHVDSKGNTLLHIMKDLASLELLLSICDIDLNRVNDKGLTPLMVNSKFARIGAIEVLTNQSGVDIDRRNFKGLSAAELAKDERTRARIEDIMLFRKDPIQDGRITSVLRSYFAEDNVHFIIKSGISPAVNSISSVKRTYSDFTFMAKWLAFELPASWIPLLNIPRNPFAVPSRPSRAVIRDVQFKLDSFLRTLLLHPTFSTHELLWEFFLVTEFSRELSSERSKNKAESRKDTLIDDYPPLDNIEEATVFFNHAVTELQRLDAHFLQTVKAGHAVQYKQLDLAEAYILLTGYFKTLMFLPLPYVEGLVELTSLYQVTDSSDDTVVQELRSSYANVHAMVTALKRPSSLLDDIAAQLALKSRYQLSLNRASTRLPLGLLDDTRSRFALDATQNIAAADREIVRLRAEVKYSQTMLASELGGFNELHERESIRIVREYVRDKIRWEKVRLKGMQGVLDKVKLTR